jgi:hypothetical protein
MRNKLLIFFTLFAVCFFPYKSSAQIIENRLNLYVGYASGLFHGGPYAEEGDFKFPSFYNNFNSLTGFTFKGAVKTHRHVSFGLIVDQLTGSNWAFDSLRVYNGASIKWISVSPTVWFHNGCQDTGIFNRLKTVVGLSPNIGACSISLMRKLDDLKMEGVKILENDLSAQSNFYGVKSNLGIEYDINQDFGVFVNYMVTYNWIKSNLHLDKKYSTSQVGLGLYKKLFRNKRYSYKF